MPDLICSVRDCAGPLSRQGDSLRCHRGHAFDRARSGYWNLLQPQDRKSGRPGDRFEAQQARGRWLERGHAVPLAALIRRIGGLDHLDDDATVLDIGCGDGWFDAQLGAAPGLDLCGIDLSARAVRVAARRLPGAAWLVANADRGLPLADASVDLVLSIFGRRPAAEIVRVLRPGGSLVIVVPAHDDLAELREAAQGRAETTDRTLRIEQELASTPLRLNLRQVWRCRRAHDRTGIDDLLTMTYRGARHGDRRRLRQRLGAATTLDVTLAAHVMRFR